MCNLPLLIRWEPTDDAQQSHQEVYDNNGGYSQPDNQAKFSHELLGGAASFEAMKLFEDHQRKEGKCHIALTKV